MSTVPAFWRVDSTADVYFESSTLVLAFVVSANAYAFFRSFIPANMFIFGVFAENLYSKL